MSNKQLGNTLEDYVCQLLANAGCWVSKLTQTYLGQPADILACKDGKTYLIDCKYCEKDTFALTRIEPNQYTSMLLFKEKGNGDGLFVLQFTDKSLYILPLNDLLELTNGKKSLTKKDLEGAYRDFSYNTWRQRCLK